MRHIHTLVTGLVVLGASSLTLAVDDPYIQGEPREKNKIAMSAQIEQNQFKY